MSQPPRTDRSRSPWAVPGLVGLLLLGMVVFLAVQRYREPSLPGRLLILAEGRFCLIDPDGWNRTPITDSPDPNGEFLGGVERARLSPERRWVAYHGLTRAMRHGVVIAGPGGVRHEPTFPGNVVAFCWAPDGSLTVTALPVPGIWNRPGTYWRVTPEDGRAEPFPLPRRPSPPGEEEAFDVQPVLEWFPDGESFVSDAPRWNESGLVARPTLRANSRDASGIPLTANDDRDENVRVSPDGTRILFSRAVRPPARQTRSQDLFVLTVAPAGDPGMARPLAGMPGPEEGFITGYCWSPDGAWVAIQLVRTLAEEPAEHELRTEIISLDGTRRRVVHVERTTVLPKGANYLDWR